MIIMMMTMMNHNHHHHHHFMFVLENIRKPETCTKQALAFNQKGIDTNYLYGEFLYDEREYKQAKVHLIVAQAAGIRDTRAKADKYRQQAISQLLAKVDKKLKR